jgi:hypothetical protein
MGTELDIDDVAATSPLAKRELEELRKDAARYKWIRDHFEWRRHGELRDDDSHAFVGARFPYLANFSCATMLDHNIDAMMKQTPNDRIQPRR